MTPTHPWTTWIFVLRGGVRAILTVWEAEV